MKKKLTSSLLLCVASAAFSQAGTAFYWVSNDASTEFGATTTEGEVTKSNWRYESTTSADESTTTTTTYYYVAPKKYDSVSVALAESDKSSNWKISEASPTGLDLSGGIDLTLGGISSGSVITVGGVYTANGFTGGDYYTSGNATLDFGTSGALFSYYTLNLSGVKLKVDLSNATNTVQTRILCGVATDTYSSLTLDDAQTISADGFTALGKYDSQEAAVAAVNATSGASFAYFASSVDGSNNALQIVYAIPEPSAFGILLGLGVLALAVSRRKRA